MPIDETERARRRALLDAHYEAENEHDLERIMATFSQSTEMIYNRALFPDHATIRLAHGYIGLSSAQGAFIGIRNVRDREHVTDDEIVVEGRLLARHTGEFQGFAATNRDVELPFVAFYRFDEKGRLTSERVVMNLGPLWLSRRERRRSNGQAWRRENDRDTSTSSTGLRGEGRTLPLAPVADGPGNGCRDGDICRPIPPGSHA